MRAFSLSILIGAVLLLAGDARGAVDSDLDQPRAAFAETDLNADNQIDVGEFHARLVEVFYNNDTNKNGFLDDNELAKLPFAESIENVDRDGNAKVSLREFVRIRMIQFRQADTNDDGELSLDEVIAAYQGRKAQ